ncbi:Fe-S oxidoreductase [Bradyrhizobium sp. i1.4.4]
MQPMNEVPFETSLAEYAEDMLDACTRCGKCVEACPSVEPAGISRTTKSEDIIGGILELVRTGNGPRKRRANGRCPACEAGHASRRAAMASIRVSC